MAGRRRIEKLQGWSVKSTRRRIATNDRGERSGHTEQKYGK